MHSEEKVYDGDQKLIIFNEIRKEIQNKNFGVFHKNKKVDSVEDYLEHFGYITQNQYKMLCAILLKYKRPGNTR